MEQSSSRRYDVVAQHEEEDDELREWAMKARVISRENTMSRRYSASYIRRDDNSFRSFRSNFTISSTASSPGGYSVKDEIDPSTYSFTTALRALQAKTMYNNNNWEYCLSPGDHGFALNSKWNEAEKYISNPLSGQVPMECLSAKTLSGRSFRHNNKSFMTNRITMSAPLVYSHSNSNSRLVPNPPPISIPEKKIEVSSTRTRDVGTQSTPPDNLCIPSPTSTPSIVERSLRKIEPAESGDSTNSVPKFKPEEEDEALQVKEKKKKKKEIILCRCSSSMRQSGCLPWMRKRQKEKQRTKRRNFFFWKV